MEFCENPPRFRRPVTLVVGNLVGRVKEMCSAAVSVVLGNIFSAILTFFFALGILSPYEPFTVVKCLFLCRFLIFTLSLCYRTYWILVPPEVLLQFSSSFAVNDVFCCVNIVE